MVGDPPKDDNKFFRNIRDAGLDPHEELGCPDATELHRVIRDMNEARDKKAAHGSTKRREITIGELLDYQACARHVVWGLWSTNSADPYGDQGYWGRVDARTGG